jgi:uncharacterized membrane-anchored protein YjiN (DUF445 family)
MMAATFAATHAVPDTTIVRLLRSMAEAGMIGEIRPAISVYVADVITSSEAVELNARFDAESGPGLQYIRVNGALLGALIGGGIFSSNMLLG